MKKFSLHLLCLCFAFQLQAQDIHFSQPQLSPLNLNPSLAGTDCGPRLVANYRNQWASILKKNAFNTAAFSYDQPIHLKNEDKIGVGSNFFYDKAGQLDFQTLSANLVGAYHKKLTSQKEVEQYLSFGFYGGVAHRSINFTRAQWASQHDGQGGFNGNLSSGENFDNDRFYFLDIGIGISWSAKLKNGHALNFGGTYAHLNRANQSFNPATDLPLYSKFVIHGDAQVKIASKLILTPRIVSIFQGSSFELNGGTGLQYLLKEETLNAIEVGVATRLANRAAPFDVNNPNNSAVTIWTDALIFNLNYVHQKFIIGVSYDFNVSDLNNASNGNGAYEATITYRFCK